jgi:hypothetical protein
MFVKLRHYVFRRHAVHVTVSLEEMSIDLAKNLNLLVAFILELLAIAAYFCVSMLVAGSGPMRYGIAAVTVGIVIALWTVFAAPRSRRRLTAPALYFFKMSVFGGAAAVLLMTHWVHIAIFFVLISIFSLALEATQSSL